MAIFVYRQKILMENYVEKDNFANRFLLPVFGINHVLLPKFQGFFSIGNNPMLSFN